MCLLLKTQVCKHCHRLQEVAEWARPPDWRKAPCQRTCVFSLMCGVYVQGKSADVEKWFLNYIKQLVKTWPPISAGTDSRIGAVDGW